MPLPCNLGAQKWRMPGRCQEDRQRRDTGRKSVTDKRYTMGLGNEGINSIRWQLKKGEQSDVDELDRLEYSGESLRSGVTLHVMEEKKVQKRKNSIEL